MIRNSVSVSLLWSESPAQGYKSNCKSDGSLQDSEAPQAHVHASPQLCLRCQVIAEISHGKSVSVTKQGFCPREQNIALPTLVMQSGNRNRTEKQVAGTQPISSSFSSSPCLCALLLCLSPATGCPRVCDARCWHPPVVGSAGWIRPNLPCASNSRHGPRSGQCSEALEEASHPDTVDQWPEVGVRLR